MIHCVAISGGKDSTCMALYLRETTDIDFVYLITPTGDELPPMIQHWENLECLLGQPLTRPPAPTLRELIDEQGCLPNWRMRWCTRMIKIEPCLEWIRAQSEPVRLYVGLRADEEKRLGLYRDDVDTVFPLREAGFTKDDVLRFLEERSVGIPDRTDCARCFYQRLGEWYRLWRDYPDIYEDAVLDEFRTGYTFRSPTKDAHPSSLTDMRTKFEAGWIPRGGIVQTDLFSSGGCRVCSM